jgi:hypothetical protein
MIRALRYFFSMVPQPSVLMQAAADMLPAKGVKTVAACRASARGA